MDFEQQQEKHIARVAAPEAALGEPNPDYVDAFGPLLVPYLAPSWRELGLVRSLGQLELDTQAQVIYTLLARRLPDLTLDDFLDLTAPEHFSPWWQATRAPIPPDQEGGDNGPPSTGRVPSRLSPWRARLSGGSTRPSTASSMPSPP
ncbi:hypothetical protein CBQ26_13655 [Deinococcus indicus]|uniref:Uncharacterized protein n=1 Tax=Deinococcus indicus TaxID=223556 RepID=A0A246BIK4_9DEIO|nr:hypothetical protein [Deinococcus indicus]OWL95092.1 hypothetical protein CBQ26_13655 [Deinococcus indicus]